MSTEGSSVGKLCAEDLDLGSAAKLELVERHAFRARVYEVAMRIVWPFPPKLLSSSFFFLFSLNDTQLSSIPPQGLCILSLLITVDIGQL